MQPSRRPSPFCSLFIPLALAGCASQGVFPAADAPNVVVIHVDDLGWADLACQGSTFFETANIDRLAREGVRFTEAYAACAVCSPSRAALQTGRWPARIGVTDWIRAKFQRPGSETPRAAPTEFVGGPAKPLLCPPNPFWMELSEVTIGERLQAAGYRTCHIGKWHLGDEAWYPQHQGYDENYGGCDYGQPPSYFDPYAREGLANGIPGLPPRREGEYLTDREADEAAGFIARNRDRRFFLHYAPYAVHTPIQAVEELTEYYRAKRSEGSPQKNAKYAAMVHSMDQAVGRILDELERHGLTEKTLIVFTSDNGGLVGPTHNLDLRSGKGFPYEGGLRVPHIVRWPGTIVGGRVIEGPICGIDVLPTVCEAVGLEVPAGIDGTSYWPVLRGEGGVVERPLFFHFPHYRYTAEVPYSVVRRGSWKLIKRYEDRFVGGGGTWYELFDLAADPSEKDDVSKRHPDVVRELDALLTDHLDAVGAQMPRANPAFEALPKVLILGDSISMAYTPHVRDALSGVARVYRPMRGNWRRAENCEGTTKGVVELERWLTAQGGDWDVIHFNFGLHDLKAVDPQTRKNSRKPSDPRQADLATYRENLEAIVAALEKTGAELVFATTTPVPEGGVAPHRDPEDVRRYNDAAREVMAAHGVAVNDLFAFAAARLSEIQRPVNVHFKPEGQKALGQQVAQVIRDRLGSR